MPDDERTPDSLKRVAAYCRVSTDEDDQINSYEIQQRKYTDKILSEPGWKMVGIYADKGITGTSIANRDEFKRMIRHCKRGRIDMIITKSVSRFARNTLDTLTYTRSLRELGIDVFFEEQNIHSIDPSSDFMISLYGSLAQSESESISENVKWGKRQSAKEGKVPFDCTKFLGYRKNENGLIEIVPEEAELVKSIFKLFLDGKTYGDIAKILNEQGIPTKGGKKWYSHSIKSILENVKYKGDILTNKTYRTSVTSKTIRKNKGEVEQFYISNHHPAIIDNATFARAHSEVERRSSMEQAFTKGAKTDNGRYNGKFVFNELLFCGECGMPYRRCVWTSNGTRRVVWRCVKRLEYGKKYCHNSPTIYENSLKSSVMNAITYGAGSLDIQSRIREHIKAGIINADRSTELKELQDRLASLTQQFDIMIDSISADSDFDEEEFQRITEEKYAVEKEIGKLRDDELSQVSKLKIEELYEILDLIENQTVDYDEDVIRRCIRRIDVRTSESLDVTFMDGTVIKCSL